MYMKNKTPQQLKLRRKGGKETDKCRDTQTLEFERKN